MECSMDIEMGEADLDFSEASNNNNSSTMQPSAVHIFGTPEPADPFAGLDVSSWDATLRATTAQWLALPAHESQPLLDHLLQSSTGPLLAQRLELVRSMKASLERCMAVAVALDRPQLGRLYRAKWDMFDAFEGGLRRKATSGGRKRRLEDECHDGQDRGVAPRGRRIEKARRYRAAERSRGLD